MPMNAHSCPEPVLTLPAFAASVGIPEADARALAHRGLIPGAKRNNGTGHYRVPVSAIEKFTTGSERALANGQGASPAGATTDPATQDGSDAAEMPAGSLTEQERTDDDR